MIEIRFSNIGAVKYVILTSCVNRLQISETLNARLESIADKSWNLFIRPGLVFLMLAGFVP